MKAWVFGGMLVLSASLAACSSSSSDGAGGGSEGGGTGDGGSGDGGSGTGSPTSTGTNTGSTSTATGSPTSTGTTTTGGGIECLGEQFLQDPVCDACVQGQCCDQLEACIADAQAGGTECFNEDGTLNESGSLAIAYLDCAETNCAEDCAGGTTGGVCDSGIAYGNPPDEELNSCLSDACCDEYTACTNGGQNQADIEACIACFQAGGTDPLCADAAACADASGCFGFEICESGISVPEQAVADCMNTNCCTEATTCWGEDGSNLEACETCIADGGGALCDDLIACDGENSCGLLSDG